MPSRLTKLEEHLRSDQVAQESARLDADALLKGDPAPAVEWAAPPPDPFGMEWTWLTAAGRDAMPVQPVVPSERVQTTERRGPSRAVGFALGAVLAASLLFAFGLLLEQRGQDKDVAFAARVTAGENVARGPGTIAEVTVENRSDRRAFLTVVGFAAGRRPAVLYRDDQLFLDVSAGGKNTIQNLPAQFDGCPSGLVVLTAAPAGEVVRSLLSDPVAPDQAEAARDKLRNDLEGMGFRGAAVEVVRLGKPLQ